MRQRLFILSVMALSITVIGGLGYIFQKSSKAPQPHAQNNPADVVILKDQTQNLSEVISGNFYLKDHEGKPKNHLSFRGRPTLVYFGYTYCPDICPQALGNLSQALHELKEDAKQFNVLFISIDPKRDNPFHMAEYLQNYHPQIIGLTGDDAQVKAAAESFKVYYNRVDENQDQNQAQDPNQTQQNNDYLMDHSSIIYVMNKQGQFVTSFNHQTFPSTITSTLRTILQR